MLEGLLHHKKEEKDYLCALVVTEERIDAALWETSVDRKAKVLKTAQVAYKGEWDKAITAADKAISSVEAALPQGKELKDVVFGLFPEWVEDDHIKENHLKQLKKLTTELSLNARGFVDLPTAVVQALQQDEGTQPTVILLGAEARHFTVSLYKIGQLIDTKTSVRSESITSDLEEALNGLVDAEVLPSRILLYGTSVDLDQVKSDLLNYPWQKRANFLHFPKIELLKEDFPVTAVALASSGEITRDMAKTDAGEPQSDQSHYEESAAEEMSEEEASDLGFVKDQDIADEDGAEGVTKADRSVVENVEPLVPTNRQIPGQERRLSGPRFRLPEITMPKLSFSVRIPRVSKIAVVALSLIVGILLVGGVLALFYVVPNAKVTLLVRGQSFDRTQDITVDVTATAVNIEKKILPAKLVEVQVTGSKSVPSTGTKTVGEKAKGEVTIFNKTLNTKTLKKGTVLTAGTLKFTLGSDVSVASASEGIGSLTYGDEKTAVTALDIGSAGNVGAGTDFSVADLPTTSYSARNDKAFAGGTSQEVSVVSRDDIASAREAVLDELKSQAKTELEGKITGNEKLLNNSTSSDVVDESFNKEVGEEANELTIEAVVKERAYAYNQDDFNKLLEEVMASQVPPNYEFKPEETKASVEEIKKGANGEQIFTTRITVNLLPKLHIEDLAQRLAGRSIEQSTRYLRDQASVSGVNFDIRAPFEFLKNTLPRNPSSIRIEVKAL